MIGWIKRRQRRKAEFQELFNTWFFFEHWAACEEQEAQEYREALEAEIEQAEIQEEESLENELEHSHDPYDVFGETEDHTNGHEFKYYRLVARSYNHELVYYLDDKETAIVAGDYLLGPYGGFNAAQVFGQIKLYEGQELAEEGDWY